MLCFAKLHPVFFSSWPLLEKLHTRENVYTYGYIPYHTTPHTPHTTHTPHHTHTTHHTPHTHTHTHTPHTHTHTALLLIVKATEEEEAILHQLHHWLSPVALMANPANPPQVIIVGSFLDKVSPNKRLLRS